MSFWALASWLRRQPGHGRVIEEEEHRRIRPHLALQLREDIPEHGAHQPRPLQQAAQLKGLHRMTAEHIRRAVENPPVLAARGKLMQDLPDTQLQDREGLEIHVRVRNPLGIDAAATRAHLDMARMVGHAHQQPAQGPLVGRPLRQRRESRRQKGMRAGAQGNAELGTQVEEPLQGNAAAHRVIQMAQRLEAQRRTRRDHATSRRADR